MGLEVRGPPQPHSFGLWVWVSWDIVGLETQTIHLMSGYGQVERGRKQSIKEAWGLGN